MPAPETRPSLILRLRNHQDVNAWTEFAQIYEPLVYRLATKMGMQHADALEAQQDVLVHLAKAVESWNPTTNGSFRGWLYRVARNVMLRRLEKQQRQPKASGDSRIHAILAEIAVADSTDGYDLEFQRQVFAWATHRVKAEVSESTWQAFWGTFIQQQSVDLIAAQLGMAPGNVYVARSRVMKRLRETVQRHSREDSAAIGSPKLEHPK